MMENSYIEHIFSYHPPKDEGVAERHAKVREACLNMALYLNETLPDSEERNVSIRRLQDVMFWANAAIARSTE